jgi:hypothetical protein
MTGRTLTIRVYGKPTHLIIAATGEIDITTVGRLRDQLFGLVSDGRPLIVELTTPDSSMRPGWVCWSAQPTGPLRTESACMQSAPGRRPWSYSS